jgi:hypothetical protein
MNNETSVMPPCLLFKLVFDETHGYRLPYLIYLCVYLKCGVIKIEDSLRSNYQNVERNDDTRRTVKSIQTVAPLKCMGQTIIKIWLIFIVLVHMCVHVRLSIVW